MPAIRVNITRARSDTSIVAPGEVAGKGKFGTTPSGSSPDVNKKNVCEGKGGRGDSGHCYNNISHYKAFQTISLGIRRVLVFTIPGSQT